MARTARRWEARIWAPNCRSYSGQCRSRTSAKESTQAGALNLARLVKGRQRRLRTGLAQGRQMGVDGRGVQRLVAQIAADLTQRHSLFQEVSGVAMAQSVRGGLRVNAAGQARQAEDFLHRGHAHRLSGLAHRPTDYGSWVWVGGGGENQLWGARGA